MDCVYLFPFAVSFLPRREHKRNQHPIQTQTPSNSIEKKWLAHIPTYKTNKQNARSIDPSNYIHYSDEEPFFFCCWNFVCKPSCCVLNEFVNYHVIRWQLRVERASERTLSHQYLELQMQNVKRYAHMIMQCQIRIKLCHP